MNAFLKSAFAMPSGRSLARRVAGFHVAMLLLGAATVAGATMVLERGPLLTGVAVLGLGFALVGGALSSIESVSRGAGGDGASAIPMIAMTPLLMAVTSGPFDALHVAYAAAALATGALSAARGCFAIARGAGDAWRTVA